nr:immunoglobulin light chain junction region [Macaca mulatta]MOX81195.1 immunoglobulin light chain junction region [Macaca mulatta]
EYYCQMYDSNTWVF